MDCLNNFGSSALKNSSALLNSISIVAFKVLNKLMNLVEVVDDDSDIRQTLAMALQSHGYAVRAHLSAQAFLTSPPTKAQRVLLLDVQVPQMTGFGLQAHLGQVGLSLPVVFMSGITTPMEKLPIGTAHGVAFLCKPFKAEALLKAVEGFKRFIAAQSRNRLPVPNQVCVHAVGAQNPKSSGSLKDQVKARVRTKPSKKPTSDRSVVPKVCQLAMTREKRTVINAAKQDRSRWAK